jgi:hypothetical protein
MLLSGFRYNINYRPGKKNVLADYLSRYPTDDETDKNDNNDPIMDVAHYDYLTCLNVPELISENKIQKERLKKRYQVTTIKYDKIVKTHLNVGLHQIGHDEDDERVEHEIGLPVNTTTDNVQNDIVQINNDMQRKLSDIINLETQAEGDSFNEAIINYLQHGSLPMDKELARRVILQEQDYYIKSNKLFHLGRVGKRVKLKVLVKRHEQLVVPRSLKIQVLQAYHDTSHYSYTKAYLSARKTWY